MDKAWKKAKTQVDLTARPLFKKTVMFALPLVLTSVLQLLYSASDIIVLGKFAGDESEAAVAAVGSTGALINLITNLFLGLSVGALAVIARFVGARDNDRIQKSVHTSVSVSVIGGLIVGVFGFAFSRTMLKWMSTPADVLRLSSLYLKIFFCGMPFNLLYNFGASVLRACGDTKRPLMILAFAGIANIGLNILTVAVFKMSVAGVGIATTVSQAVSAIGIVIALMRRKDAARLCFKKLKINKAALVDIIRIGLPAGIQGTVFSLSNVVIQSSINSFDDVAVVAANAAAANIEGFVYVAMNSVAQACLTVAGQNYGAAKPENIDLSLIQCLLLVTGVGLVFGVGVYLAARPLLQIYGCKGISADYGVERLKVICTLYFMCGIMEVLVSALRAIGRSVLPMLVSIVGIVGLRIIWVYTIFKVRHTLLILYLSYPVSWLLTLAIHFVCYMVLRRKAFDKLREMKKADDVDCAATADNKNESSGEEKII